ncbi:restriction endonuclease subunit S [Marinomonas piezotolerans]|uniref:Restriction endonuclease subunit S n=2 Tax=Marinomonas piezotolerans TaxID=2213058 RepID=A0A370UEM2_9GAMM|nr:restriction endonuclease subunit S [Marinomonas piezotolerans]
MVKLGDIFDITSSKRVLQKDWTKSGVPFYRAREVVTLSKQGFVDNDLFISEEMYSEFSEKYGVPQEGDILVTAVGTLGQTYAVKKSDKFYFKDASVIRLSKKQEVDTSYVQYALKSPDVQRFIQNSSGATVGTYTISRANETEIPLPPLEEQKRIAAILDKADTIRRKRQQAIDLADEFLRSVFLDMFGSKVNKSGWEEVRFDEVAFIDAKMVDPRESEYLDLLHIGPDRIEKNTGKLLPALTAREENLISKKFLFDQTYVLYSKIRPYLRKVALPNFVGLCSADMYPVRPKDGLLTREFLWQLLLSDDFTKYTETLPDRASIPKLNRNELTSYRFKLPPIDLQEKFSAILRKQYQGYLSNKASRKISDSAFGALSQKAFSGELLSGKWT